jgi:hypothetical protein
MDACVRWRRWAKMALCIVLRRGRGDGSGLFGPVLAPAKSAEGYKRAGSFVSYLEAGVFNSGTVLGAPSGGKSGASFRTLSP